MIFAIPLAAVEALELFINSAPSEYLGGCARTVFGLGSGGFVVWEWGFWGCGFVVWGGTGWVCSLLCWVADLSVLIWGNGGWVWGLGW